MDYRRDFSFPFYFSIMVHFEKKQSVLYLFPFPLHFSMMIHFGVLVKMFNYAFAWYIYFFIRC